jgi:hypothetical protein
MVSCDTRVIGCRTKLALCPHAAVFEVARRGDRSHDVDSELLDGDVVRLWRNVWRPRNDSELYGASRAETIGADVRMIGADVQMIGADVQMVGADVQMVGADVQMVGADERS